MAKKKHDLTSDEQALIASSLSAIQTINAYNNFNINRNSIIQFSDTYATTIELFKKNVIDTKIFDYQNIIKNFSLSPSFENISILETEITKKENNIRTLINDLKNEKFEKSELESKLTEINESYMDYKKSQELLFLTSKIHQDAINIVTCHGSKLLSDFTGDESKEMVVISIDIRRSTDLMLKATSHENFAKFISGLSELLKNIVINNYGVFDKFTGDGILAYFPLFYSGENAILNCLKTAQECHVLFQKYYNDNKSLFSVVIKTGLGIGIDYGNAKIVRINEEQTIVGTPVVYACRLSIAPYGHTYINQQAYDSLVKKEIVFNFVEKEVEIKNEGLAIIYDILSVQNVEVQKPKWE